MGMSSNYYGLLADKQKMIDLIGAAVDRGVMFFETAGGGLRSLRKQRTGGVLLTFNEILTLAGMMLK